MEAPGGPRRDTGNSRKGSWRHLTPLRTFLEPRGNTSSSDWSSRSRAWGRCWGEGQTPGCVGAAQPWHWHLQTSV